MNAQQAFASDPLQFLFRLAHGISDLFCFSLRLITRQRLGERYLLSVPRIIVGPGLQLLFLSIMLLAAMSTLGTKPPATNAARPDAPVNPWMAAQPRSAFDKTADQLKQAWVAMNIQAAWGLALAIVVMYTVHLVLMVLRNRRGDLVHSRYAGTPWFASRLPRGTDPLYGTLIYEPLVILVAGIAALLLGIVPLAGFLLGSLPFLLIANLCDAICARGLVLDRLDAHVLESVLASLVEGKLNPRQASQQATLAGVAIPGSSGWTDVQRGTAAEAFGPKLNVDDIFGEDDPSPPKPHTRDGSVHEPKPASPEPSDKPRS